MIIYSTLWRYFVCADQVRIEDPPQEERRSASGGTQSRLVSQPTHHSAQLITPWARS